MPRTRRRPRRHLRRLALAPIMAWTLTLQGCEGLSALTGLFTAISSAIAPVQQVIGVVSQLPGSPLSSGLGQKVLGILDTTRQVTSKVRRAQALTNTARRLDPTRLPPQDTIRQASSLVSGSQSLLGLD